MIVLLTGFVPLTGCDDPGGLDRALGFRISPESAEIPGGDSLEFRVLGLRTQDLEWELTFQREDRSGSFPVEYPEMLGEDGWVRGLRAGSGLLIASSDGIADTASISVVPGPPAGAHLGWIGPTLWARHSYKFSAGAHDRVGNPVDADLAWASETPERLSLADDGTALALDSGTGTFTVGLAGAEPSDTASVPIVPFSGEWQGFGLGIGTSALGVWCALDTGGRASCSGANVHGQLGIETAVDYLGAGRHPNRRGASFGYPVDTDVLFQSLELGQEHVCALGEDGLAYCWGDHSAIGNQAGVQVCHVWPTYDVHCRFEPRPVSRDLTFLDISPSCGVTAAGDVWCWGETPELIFSGTPLRTLEGSREEGCGLSQDGAAYCWGSNAYGQLGTGSTDTLPHPDPVLVDTELRFTELSRSGGHACGLTAAGEVWCWGSGTYGQLGTEATLEACPDAPGWETLPCAPSPVRVSSDATFTTVEAGREHSCGLTRSGAVYCWGANGSGQVSPDGPAPDDCGGTPCSRAPRTIPLPTAATSVTAGIYATCAGMVDGSFDCWGNFVYDFEPIGVSVSP